MRWAPGSEALSDLRAASDFPRVRRPKEIEVYTCYDVSGVVIYVGRTDRFGSRWSQHVLRRPDLVAETRRVSRKQYATYGDSLVAEALLIREHQPRFNREGVTR